MASQYLTDFDAAATFIESETEMNMRRTNVNVSLSYCMDLLYDDETEGAEPYFPFTDEFIDALICCANFYVESNTAWLLVRSRRLNPESSEALFTFLAEQSRRREKSRLNGVKTYDLDRTFVDGPQAMREWTQSPYLTDAIALRLLEFDLTEECRDPEADTPHSISMGLLLNPRASRKVVNAVIESIDGMSDAGRLAVVALSRPGLTNRQARYLMNRLITAHVPSGEGPVVGDSFVTGYVLWSPGELLTEEGNPHYHHLLTSEQRSWLLVHAAVS